MKDGGKQENSFTFIMRVENKVSSSIITVPPPLYLLITGIPSLLGVEMNSN
jgi:hypothetical protein